jgi:lysozyme family protein
MSSERFLRAVEFVLANEGGDSCDSRDRGGRTRFGITEQSAARHRLDVRRLTLNQARMIYFMDYWDHAFDLITDEVLARRYSTSA